MGVQTALKYDIGDIVFVREYKYPNGNNGNSHLFVIIGDDGELVPAEYFGLIVSSHTEKSKEVSNYKFNEPLKKNTQNGLTKDSIVRCDDVYSLQKEYVVYKIGSVDAGDFIRFITSYNNSLNENK